MSRIETMENCLYFENDIRQKYALYIINHYYKRKIKISDSIISIRQNYNLQIKANKLEIINRIYLLKNTAIKLYLAGSKY